MALSRGSSLEVVSEEHFRVRRDGISNDQCDGCMKERCGGRFLNAKESKKARKRRKKEQKVARVNTPIVVRLRDTIKHSPRNGVLQNKDIPVAGTESTSSTDTEDNTVDTVKRRNTRNENLRAKAIRGSMRVKGEKNFLAFLSAVKKVHSKEPKNGVVTTKSLNLNAKNIKNNERRKSAGDEKTLLNNQRDCKAIIPPCKSTLSADTPAWNPMGSAMLSENNNVKVVRNDLHSTVTKQDSLDSENGDSASSLSPSPTPSSDTDVESSAGSSVEWDELSRDELSYLSNFTSGAPLTRFVTSQRGRSATITGVRSRSCLAVHGIEGECTRCISEARHNSFTNAQTRRQLSEIDDDTSSSQTSQDDVINLDDVEDDEDIKWHSCREKSDSSHTHSSGFSTSCTSSSDLSSDDVIHYPVKDCGDGLIEISLKPLYEEKVEVGPRNHRSQAKRKNYRNNFKNNYYNHQGGYYPPPPPPPFWGHPGGYYSPYHHPRAGSYNPHYIDWYNPYSHHNRGYHSHNNSAASQQPYVFIDLTDCDVTIEVTYLNNEETNSSGTAGTTTISKPFHDTKRSMYEGRLKGNMDFASDMFYGPPPMGYFPYALPYYMTPPHYYMCPLMMPIPRPICVPRDTPCLDSKRMCLLPAHQAKAFTASQPSQRPWLQMPNTQPPSPNRPVAIFTVMCYNVLCDMYCTRQLYGYCPSWALSWEFRKNTIIEEIRQYSADIITLQEVETEQFYSFFLPMLKPEGYSGIFSPKSRAKTMSDTEKKRVDGCAIFYKSGKFNLVKEHLIEFNQLAMSNSEGSHEMINRVMTKDNIGLCAVLETKENVWEPGLPSNASARQPLIVATCHIHWDPEFSDVKLIQTMLFINELKKIADENKVQQSLRPGGSQYTASGSNQIPIMLCGDLNSLPESGVVEYLNTGRVSYQHEDFRQIKYSDSLKKLPLDGVQEVYTHDFKLKSAYDPGVIPFTNYTYDFKGIIDYIFYSCDTMRPLGVLGQLDPEWFRHNKVLGFPHPHVPSDHLPLLVEIEMSPSISSSPATPTTPQQNISAPGFMTSGLRSSSSAMTSSFTSSSQQSNNSSSSLIGSSGGMRPMLNMQRR